MRALLVLLLLTSCGKFWGDVPVARIHAEGGDAAWGARVAWAAGVWNTHLRGLGCPPPFVTSESSGHAIVLVPSARWTSVDAAGYAEPDLPWRVGRVLVVDRLSDYDRDTVLLHELGHAIGLDHSDDPSSIMRAPPMVRYVSFQDLVMAARKMRCAGFR